MLPSDGPVEAVEAPRLTRETALEALALVVFLFAVFTLVSLIAHANHPRLVGAVGREMGVALSLAMGRVGSYAVPLFLVMFGATLFRGAGWGRFAIRTVGLFGVAVSLGAVFSLAARAHGGVVDRQSALAWAGVAGEFLVHRDGLGLPYLFGVIGAWMFAVGALVVSAFLLTDFFYARPLWRAWRRWREWAREREERRLARAKTFPVSDPFQVFGPPKAEVRDDYSEEDMGEAPPLETTTTATRQRVSKDRGEIEIVSATQGDLFQTPLDAPTEARAPRAARERARPARRRKVETTSEPDLFGEYELPPLTLLSPRPENIAQTPKETLYDQAEILERKLADFGIEAKVTHIVQGPVITRFELKPAAGVKISRIVTLERDIAMAMSAVSVRILAPIPGKDAVGIEAPNPEASPVFLREVMESPAIQKTPKPLAFCLGKDISGEPQVCDLAKMPHLLIAGTTGSGKSVCLNAIICSILMRMTPDRVKMLMVDPKRVELNVYRDIPHLLAPVVSDPRKAAGALNWVVQIMEERYELLAGLNVRNIDGYNALLEAKEPSKKLMGRELEPMFHIVVIIDELADLMLMARNEVEELIIRLAQMARAVGIHLILATQRPSVNVITGIIKANFPARIAFQVSSKVDSRTILDMNGAEALLGRGDMLYLAADSPRPERIQGCYVSDKEVEDLADFVRTQQPVEYMKEDFSPPPAKGEAKPPPSSASRDGKDWEVMGQMVDDSGAPLDAEAIYSEYLADDLFRSAVKLVLSHRKASVSLIQRRLKVGFARSGRLMDMMEEAGLVGEHQGSKPREILIDPVEYLNLIEQYESERDDE